jgi:hypothetical protein
MQVTNGNDGSMVHVVVRDVRRRSRDAGKFALWS